MRLLVVFEALLGPKAEVDDFVVARLHLSLYLVEDPVIVDVPIFFWRDRQNAKMVDPHLRRPQFRSTMVGSKKDRRGNQGAMKEVLVIGFLRGQIRTDNERGKLGSA